MSLPLFFETPQGFRAWLSANGATAQELIVGFHKTATGTPCMTWSESVDEALCFGWIDGVRKRIDELSYSIRFTPRKQGSIWSAVNIAKVARMTADKRMTAGGNAAYAKRTEAKSAVYSHEQNWYRNYGSAKSGFSRETRLAGHFLRLSRQVIANACCTGSRLQRGSQRAAADLPSCCENVRWETACRSSK